MKRKIIHIDEELCDGCGLCIPNCPEGAIQIIDGKARLISDLFCDGLGACLGHCPRGAIEIKEREAEPFSETRVMENIIPKGNNTIKAHLEHLLEHDEDDFYREAVAVLEAKGIPVPDLNSASDTGKSPGASPVSGCCSGHSGHGAHGSGHSSVHGGGCPGSMARSINAPAASTDSNTADISGQSELRQWPVQMHLINPQAPYFKNSDLLIAADCSAFAVGDFHSRILKGKTLAIACPKLDQAQESYLPKIKALIEEARINSISVLIMEVPCCRGLLSMVRQAVSEAGRKVPVKLLQAGLDGSILREEWV